MNRTDKPAASGKSNSAIETAPTSPAWQTRSSHRFYLRDDVLYWECHGPMMVPDLMAMFEERTAMQRQHGRVFVIVDASAIDNVPAETRKRASQFKPDPPIRGTAVVFGASLLTRTLISLIIAAARLLGQAQGRTMYFAADEVEAWAIVERERQALLRTG